MDTTDTTRLHPLHALYLRQSHGEVSTLALRARLAREGMATGHGAAATDRGAALLAGLGLAAARLVGTLTGGA